MEITEMWKYILALTILTHCVECRITPDERQWKEDDAREHCITTCHDDCDYCEEPTHCTIDEDKCGEKAPKVHPNCSPNDICVPAGCECETTGINGEPCTLICPPDCSDEEIQCPGCKVNCPNGCLENDWCHPKGTDNDGNTCPGFCPFQCGDDEITCPDPNCTPPGCECPPLCILMQNDNQGDVCIDQQCPLICDVTEILCVGSIDHQGCKEDDVCIAKDISNTGDLCSGNCPVTCEDSEIKCDGVVVWIDGATDGCVGPDECKAKAKDVNMEYCEDDSHSHDCPISCPPWEIFCPPLTTILGCLEEAHCTPRSNDNDGNYCPDIIDCPPPCKPGEVPCPDPDGDYENGCKRADLCIQQVRDFDGELCSVECPINCAENEILCPGQRDEIGCLDAPVCVVRERKDRGEDIGALCPGWCPAKCASDEVLCPSQVDPCDGCPTEELCVEAQTDLNDIFCPGQNYPNEPLSASHNCPILCDDLTGYVLCPPHENENGCKLEAECRLRELDSDNQWCPSHSVCPVHCDNDEILCHFGTDERNCRKQDICLNVRNDKDGNPCSRSCPPECLATEVFCPGSALPNGCVGGDTCVDRGFDVNGIICPAVCPPSCQEGEILQYGGTNFHGCAIASTCSETVEIPDLLQSINDYMADLINSFGEDRQEEPEAVRANRRKRQADLTGASFSKTRMDCKTFLGVLGLYDQLQNLVSSPQKIANSKDEIEVIADQMQLLMKENDGINIDTCNGMELTEAREKVQSTKTMIVVVKTRINNCKKDQSCKKMSVVSASARGKSAQPLAKDVAVLKKLGESCGSCYCPPTFTAGECESHLECVHDPFIADGAGECMIPVICCDAMTASCMACKQRKTVEEFCSFPFNQNVIGCDGSYEKCGLGTKCLIGQQCCVKKCNEIGELVPDSCMPGTDCPIPSCNPPGPEKCGAWPGGLQFPPDSDTCGESCNNHVFHHKDQSPFSENKYCNKGESCCPSGTFGEACSDKCGPFDQNESFGSCDGKNGDCMNMNCPQDVVCNIECRDNECKWGSWILDKYALSCGEVECSPGEECCMTCDEDGQQIPNNICGPKLKGRQFLQNLGKNNGRVTTTAAPPCPVVDCMPPVVCCMAMNAECLACKAGQSVGEFCNSKANSGVPGCGSNDPCSEKACGEMCIVGGDMAGQCDGSGECSFEYGNLGCNPCNEKACGDTCIVQGDIAGACDVSGECSFDYDHLGCVEVLPPPPELVMCKMDTFTCPDGTVLSHDPWNDCEFPPCPEGCSKELNQCPDGSSVGRDPMNNCKFFPCPNGCSKELNECPDGSSVGRDPENNCKFFPCPNGCNRDAFTCPDGSSVGRDPENDCDFFPCPNGCTRDAITCPDGSSVGRDPANDCQFSPCPEVFCTEDAFQCPDGSSVGRNPVNNCRFHPCPYQKCPAGVEEARCSVDPCRDISCQSNPDATCVPNYCGGCAAVFYHNNGDVAECGPTPPGTACETSREEGLKNSDSGMVGGFIPQCDDDGYYEPVQMNGSTGYSWCVDEQGNTIEGSERGPGEGAQSPATCIELMLGGGGDGIRVPDPCNGKSCGDMCIVQGDIAGHCNVAGECSFDYGNLGCGPTPPGTACQTSREEGLMDMDSGMVGGFIPQCNENGDYEPAQMNDSTGHSWCVDEKGNTIEGSERGPDEGQTEYALCIALMSGGGGDGIPDPCHGKSCGDTCIVQGDMAGQCNVDGECSFDYGNLGCGTNQLLDCITVCTEEACAPDVDFKIGCNQMYSCSHGCKMRQLGLDEPDCKNNCDRNGQSGCNPTVNEYEFDLCQECQRSGCNTWPTIEECEIGCSSYSDDGPCSGKTCGDTCIVGGDMAGVCNAAGECSFEYDNLGCASKGDPLPAGDDGE